MRSPDRHRRIPVDPANPFAKFYYAELGHKEIHYLQKIPAYVERIALCKTTLADMLNNPDYPLALGVDRQRAIENYEGLIVADSLMLDVLKRQLYALRNPRATFHIEETPWSYMAMPIWRPIFDDDEHEILYQLLMAGDH